MENRKRIILKLIFVLVGIMVALTLFSNTIHNLNVAGIVVGLDAGGDITKIHRGFATLGYTETFYTQWASHSGHIHFLVKNNDLVAEDDPLFTIHTEKEIKRDEIFDRIVYLRQRNTQLPRELRAENTAEIERLEALLEYREDEIIEVIYTQNAVVGGVVSLSPGMEDRAPVTEGQPVLQLAVRQGHHFEFSIDFPGSFIPVPTGAVTREIEFDVPSLRIPRLSGEIDHVTTVDDRFRVDFTIIVPGASGGERVNVVITDVYTTGVNQLPNDAIREDARGGDFILVARQVPNTLLGYSYFAERVDIEVTLRGDQHTVFTMRNELEAPVILQSDRPIEEGDRVRMVGAADVTGLPVYIMDDVYTVSGIVESVAGSVASTVGFAWIPCFEAKNAELLYINPANYNPLSARLDAERLLEYMGFQANAFTITDGNSFVQSITLRGQLLLALCLPVFLIAVVFWLVSLFRSAKSKAAYTTAGVFSALTLAATVYFAWNLASIDLWLPAYVGEGPAGYSRLLFNKGTLAPDVYLPMHLAALVEVNLKANIAFFTGLFGLVIIGITRFLTGKSG